jgi:hypothetical protein
MLPDKVDMTAKTDITLTKVERTKTRFTRSPHKIISKYFFNKGSYCNKMDVHLARMDTNYYINPAAHTEKTIDVRKLYIISI